MPRTPSASDLQERFIVRFPVGMRDQIAEAARLNNRSMNSEIVARLAESFTPGALPPEAEAALAASKSALAASEAGLAALSEKLDTIIERMPKFPQRK